MMGHRPRHWLEYLTLRAMVALLRLLPRPLAQGLLWLLARLAFSLLRFRRAETLRRIREVYGTSLPLRRQRRIAWLSLRNTFFNALDLARFDRFDAAWMESHVANHAMTIARLRELVAQHGSLVIALPHCGNWDLAGLAVSLAGLPIFSVAGQQRNRLVNAWLNGRRRQGIAIVTRGSAALRQVIARLRRGEIFAILPDVRSRHPGLSVPFLGGTANLGRGLARFARTANAPILPVVVRRVGWSRHSFDLLAPVMPDRAAPKEAELQRLTTQVMTALDHEIRKTPEQWFWYNRRWVLQPLEGGNATERAAQERPSP